MSTTHEVRSAGEPNTKFYLASMPEMGRYDFGHRLQNTRSEEERIAWFTEVFYWLYEGYETGGGEIYGRSYVLAAMHTKQYATLMARATKDKKSLRAFFEKLIPDEPEQKPAVEFV